MLLYRYTLPPPPTLSEKKSRTKGRVSSAFSLQVTSQLQLSPPPNQGGGVSTE